MSEKIKINPSSPFAYGEVEQRAINTFYKQRDAQYKEAAQEVYNGNEKEAFMYNVEAPTPQIKEVDGYKSAKEIDTNE